MNVFPAFCLLKNIFVNVSLQDPVAKALEYPSHLNASHATCSCMSYASSRRYLRLSGVEPPLAPAANASQQHAARGPFNAASPHAEQLSTRAQTSKFAANASTISSLATDNLSHYGDVSGRIAQLQQQSLQELAVIDANAQEQVRVTVQRRPYCFGMRSCAVLPCGRW
jgi:hypothetical protein